jgi:hypothetical protein
LPRLFETGLIKRVSHIVLSAWLAILLLFGGTSKEFVHLFSGHEDTIHSHNSQGGLVAEPEHHHCSFLQYSLATFINDVQAPFVPTSYTKHPAQYNETLVACVYATDVVVTSLRGPPIM